MRTQIEDISLSQQGTAISVSVVVRNIYSTNLNAVMVDGAVEYGPQPYPGVDFGGYSSVPIDANETYTFTGQFTEPPQNCLLRIRSRHYETDRLRRTGSWVIDDEQTVEVVVESDPTPPTEIVKVTSVESAMVGEEVEIEVMVKNHHTQSLSVRIDGQARVEGQGSSITIPFPTSSIPAGGTHTFNGSFKMPENKVSVIVRSAHYENGHWFNWGNEESWDIVVFTGNSRIVDFKVSPNKASYNPGEVVTFSGKIEVSEIPGIFPWRTLKDAAIHLIANQVNLTSAKSDSYGVFKFVNQLPHSNRTDYYKAHFAGNISWKSCDSSTISMKTYSEPSNGGENGNGSPPPPPPPGPAYKCTYCPAEFYTKEELDNHIKTQHSPDAPWDIPWGKVIIFGSLGIAGLITVSLLTRRSK